MLSPRQAFEDNIRPAELLLRVYRLLENDTVHTSGEMLKSLRTTIGASADEDLMMIYNEIFLGLVREKADIHSSNFKKSSLCNLLRQSIVTACAALETFLQALMQINLPVVIQARVRDFFPQDKEVQGYFVDLTFSLSETLRLNGDGDAALFIANKILKHISSKYLNSTKGIFTTAALLSVETPLDQLATRLQREKKDMLKTIENTTQRRNDIVHRADRSQSDPSGPQQDISYAQARQAVDTIKHVCLALDELVDEKIKDLKTQIDTIQV